SGSGCLADRISPGGGPKQVRKIDTRARSPSFVFNRLRRTEVGFDRHRLAPAEPITQLAGGSGAAMALLAAAPVRCDCRRALSCARLPDFVPSRARGSTTRAVALAQSPWFDMSRRYQARSHLKSIVQEQGGPSGGLPGPRQSSRLAHNRNEDACKVLWTRAWREENATDTAFGDRNSHVSRRPGEAGRIRAPSRERVSRFLVPYTEADRADSRCREATAT